MIKKLFYTLGSFCKQKIRRHPIISAISGGLLVWYIFLLPSELFPLPYSTVLESSDGKLLAAKIANDGQWRFPQIDSVPYRFKMSVLEFEDAYFYYHWGVNPISVGKALWRNIGSGRIKRGGSTLTQQVVRIAREHQERTYFEKIIEMIWATRLEFKYSKESILRFYASHAPYGGNVVGLPMASWRYFGVAPHQLSWAQAATLAVLPNAPSLIFPGKNQERLLKKRNALLQKLRLKNIIDQDTYDLALLEPLPTEPHPVPQITPHLLTYAGKTHQGQRLSTTINSHLQEKVNNIVSGFYTHYSQSEIYNMAALVVEVKTRKVLAYVGNTPTDSDHQKDVDIIHAPRSTGSVLKPLLYAAMLHEGELLPTQLIPDVPTQIAGYSPQNFSNSFEGAVPANSALAKSLNIPFVWLLKQFTTYRFYDVLQQLRLRNINKHPDHYGLSIILGGAESNLWDLAQAYTNLASLNEVFAHQQHYRSQEFQPLRYLNESEPIDFGKATNELPTLRAGAVYEMFNAMKEVNRPTDDVAWRYYESARKVAWKTGTSFGNKDAWAIGATPEYVVAVWVGNATGEGRPTLTGASYAAPVMFRIFSALPSTTWFTAPLDDLRKVTVCEDSGFLAKPECPQKTIFSTLAPKEIGQCPYHKIVHLDPSEKYQVNANCQSVQEMHSKAWFVLPPVMEWYYKQQHMHYRSLPPFRPDCTEGTTQKGLAFIYPKHQSIIYTTKDFGGKLQPFVAKAANRSGKVFWYLDNQHLGTTDTFHEMNVYANKGKHWLRIINEAGDEKVIEILVQSH